LVTDSPRRTQLIRDLVERLVEERSRVQFMRFEVKHIAASIARDRILALIGSAPETGLGQFIQPQQPGAKGAPGVAQPISVGAPGQTSTNFSELRLDPQSNALLFMGRAADGAYIEQMLALVDAPNTLVSRWYPVGGQAAEAIAAAASREGLGDITYQETEGVTQPVGAPGLNVPQAGFQQFGQQGQRGLQGSGFVIYPESGGFMYHGTLTQHARVDALVGELEPLTRGEQIVYEFYKLKYAKAEDVAEIIQNLLSNQLPTGNEGAILGRDLGAGRDRLGSQRDRAIRAAQQAQQQQQQQPGGEGQAAIFGDENTFVLADEKNNQIVVKAVQRVQPQFHDLIQRLDLRRPQVFINAKIIAVTDSMNFRLAVETQIIAGQFGLNTDFGLSRFGDNSFTQPKMVDTGLAGLTSALVKSEYVPFILHALQNNTDARVLATPQLLVDANEEAEISSVNVVPTQVSSQSNSTTITSQGEDATAGTTLIVTPQISESSVKLDLDITQSSFTGAPSAPGLAPPSLENHLASASVTVPPDATVVIGGLTLESVQNTIIKVPLLGDIPLVKHLFRDTNKSSQRATLYVFLTPTIMRDPNFADLRLLTRGPMAAVRLEPEVEVPPAEPISARILEPAPQRIETVPAGPSVKP
jgi:type II secretory pathway component GspD/PulD (secretin)